MPSPFLFLVTFTILLSFCSFKLWFRMRIISENWFNHTLHNLLTKIMCIKSVGDFRLVEMFWMCFASKSKKKGEVRLNCMASKFNNKFEFAMAKLITHTHTHTRDPIQNQGKHVPSSQFPLRSKSVQRLLTSIKEKNIFFFLCIHVVGHCLRLVNHLDVLCAHIDDRLNPFCVVGHPGFLCVCVANCPILFMLMVTLIFFHFANSIDPLLSCWSP